ncbi:MAG: hypothetical protein ABSG43_13705 [Solirubrobacteraceae bacterium]
MSYVSHTATFSPTDPLARMLEDLDCPVCGHHDPGDAHRWITDNKVRIFCDCCGAFITISMTDDQARAIHKWSAALPAIDDRGVHARRTEAVG